MYAGRRQEIEDMMIAELSEVGISERETLIIQACAVIATRVVAEELRKERREFQRDLERLGELVDEAQYLGRAVSRALR